MEEWTIKAAGLMHYNKISNIDVSKNLGVTAEYVSMLLNGKKKPANAETRIMTAISDIIRERESKNNA